jgi:OOP family OmpA-OmpF porin
MRSTTIRLLTAAVLTAMPGLALAQPVNGFYVSGALGMAFPHNQAVTSHTAPDFMPAPMVSASPPSTAAIGQGSVGYGLGNGLRFEVEGTGGASRLRLPKWP